MKKNLLNLTILAAVFLCSPLAVQAKDLVVQIPEGWVKVLPGQKQIGEVLVAPGLVQLLSGGKYECVAVEPESFKKGGPYEAFMTLKKYKDEEKTDFTDESSRKLLALRKGNKGFLRGDAILSKKLKVVWSESELSKTRSFTYSFRTADQQYRAMFSLKLPLAENGGVLKAVDSAMKRTIAVHEKD